jgi:hypothetical protein
LNISETRELLQEIAAIDKRQITPETIQAWHNILGNLSLEVAKEAHKLARKDLSVNYLEPRHIYGWSKEATSALQRNQPKSPEPERPSTPEPNCRGHKTRITDCKPCIKELGKQTDLNAEDLHAWAVANIYDKSI